ncbi:GNAT family N-acetyltransferase [Flavihumibacter fluvii]|uniref:GNAT family N-acetyltransferase n=1 Tax=Flavihumibacter fluvii TaxID=2838157 RepID=UPI001BDF090F|nr:GNAT family N-acetyltransferase [Flavihumibacter fluvii]ULQ54188.1 GNAT family N-acetyltransferase [Flavihumibacter fluvii]
MKSIETKRTIISALQPLDAPFIYSLLNSPGWLRFIGDRGIRTLDDARNFIINGPMKSYQDNGFGLCLVQEKESGNKMGLCGLLKREQLDNLDLGFAFLPEYHGKGYAKEAATAMINYAREALKLNYLLAFTDADNIRSIQLLEKLGFVFDKMIPWPNSEDLKLFAINLSLYASE